MRVAALLSGGKDSVAAIEVAQMWGWSVPVALTIVPAADDAWMFHTPNLAVVQGVAACLGIPLVEAPCRAGAALEVEDLEAALRPLQAAYGLEGILSGALASEYQRTRIDAVGHRLGLKTFAPLWHKDPVAHVHGLLAAGYDIRFSRTAGDGVPNAWAGQALDAARLAAMMAHAARPHPAGEGGEYETLVLDAPHYLHRLVVDEAQIEASPSRATWRISRWHTVPKDGQSPAGAIAPSPAHPHL